VLAAIFNGPYNISLADYPLARLEPEQLLVKVGACGVCGTDFHIYEGKSPSKPPFDMTLIYPIKLAAGLRFSYGRKRDDFGQAT